MRDVIAALARLDRSALAAAARCGRQPAVAAPLRVLTKAGEHGALWNVISLVGWAVDRRRAHTWWAVGAAARRGYVLNQLVKLGVRRPRPQLDEFPQAVKTGSQRSFPSAHATTSFAAARVLNGLLPAVPVYALATAVALSRPVFAVHYPSDSLGGALLGHLTAGPVLKELER